MSTEQPTPEPVADPPPVPVVSESPTPLVPTVPEPLAQSVVSSNGEPKLPEKKPLVDDGRMPAALWVKREQRFSGMVYLYKKVATGELMFVTVPSGKLTDDQKNLLEIVEYKVEFIFSMPTQKQLSHYRELCSKWDRTANDYVISRGKMRRLMVRYHLMGTNIPDPRGDSFEPMKLEREKGRLKPEIEEVILQLHPTVLDLLLVRFELEANIVY